LQGRRGNHMVRHIGDKDHGRGHIPVRNRDGPGQGEGMRRGPDRLGNLIRNRNGGSTRGGRGAGDQICAHAPGAGQRGRRVEGVTRSRHADGLGAVDIVPIRIHDLNIQNPRVSRQYSRARGIRDFNMIPAACHKDDGAGHIIGMIAPQP